jgi:hypothetical protein
VTDGLKFYVGHGKSLYVKLSAWQIIAMLNNIIAMNKYLLLCFLSICKLTIAQNFTINGYVRDAETGEALLFANCFDSTTFKGTITNPYGFYTLSLPKGKVRIVVSYVGYKDKLLGFVLTKDTTVSFELESKTEELQEVVVSSHIPIHQQVIMGKITVPLKTIEAIPSFAGEADLMKAICYIPGISAGREGYSNIYVRGGDRGQNLTLLDGAKLYNTNHVGGFVSLFNSNIIKHLDVYKGGFPARYGGRASSVIDIYTKDGNRNNFHGKYNIGLLSSGLLFEGPLKKNISFIFAVRSSYYDLFTLPARRNYKQTGTGFYFGYTFFDINSKISWEASDKNRLFLSFFTGHDLQKSEDADKASFQESISSNKLKIHNTGISLGQNYIIAPKLFVKNSVAYSSYNNKLESYDKLTQYGSSTTDKYYSFSEINDFTIQSRFEYSPNTFHSIKTGIELSYYSFIPGMQNTFTENLNTNSTLDTTIGFVNALSAFENNIYLEDELHISGKLWLYIGIRGTSYICKDTIYYGAEPRLSFRWLITKSLSYKANYTIMNQSNHVLVNNYMGFEKEIWIAATKNLPPQKAEQISTGLFYSYGKKNIEISVEVFYKTMANLLEYHSPVDDEDNLNNIENIVAKDGKGESYGIETQIAKSEGRVNGSINYTLAWNYRQFYNLNNGKKYPFIYDRRHDLSIVSTYTISNTYSFNANFVLSSGMPFTLPEGFIKQDDFFYHYYAYSGINNRRLPLYHRLDVSLVKKGKTRKGNNKQFEINIFNVYARKNPVYIYYDSNTGKVFQKSLFSIIPTLSYSVEF